MLLFSIIIPTLNESESIKHTLEVLTSVLDKQHEIIIVDGGSTDDTVLIASRYTNKIHYSEKGRALQMNEGAKHARHSILIFLHADTLVPNNFPNEIRKSFNYSEAQWGFFKVKLSNADFMLSVISFFMNLRSCLTKIATGDQVFVISKDLYRKINGFKTIPLMEDIEFSKSLKKICKPICFKLTVITSSRKWKQQGIINTVLLMWKIRLLYFFGIPATKLVTMYYK